jgi:hypothetical protein
MARPPICLLTPLVMLHRKFCKLTFSYVSRSSADLSLKS